jgi:phage terminase small subunit
MSICIVVEVPMLRGLWDCGRPKLAIIAGNKAQIARNSEEIPMELAAFPGKPLPKPPGHLKAGGRRLWTDIVTQYRIADGAGLALVTTAAEALDRIREAQAAIRKHGALVADRYGGVKQNPACFLERDARAGMLSALRALNLDLEPLRDRGRPTVFDRK